MSILTISRQVGSFGTEIARELAEKLGWEYVDKGKIGEALARFGFGMLEVEKFDEKKPPFWDSFSLLRNNFIHALQMTIYDFARKGRVVIVGRGGQVLLGDLPGALHVRIFAPFDLRVKRLIWAKKADEKYAAQMLRRFDHDSAGYIQSFFRVNWDDPSLYDLMINTAKLSRAAAVQMIADSLSSREIQEGVEKGKEKAADLVLVRKAETRLMPLLGSDYHHLEIRAEKGVIFLRGTVTSRLLKEECERITAVLEGVKHVENQLSIAKHYRHSD
jgi:cytidylate kinase